MTAKPKAREPRSRKPSSSNDITERIRRRAYELCEERGRVDGFSPDDWLRAEAEIRGTEEHGSKSKPIKKRRQSQD